MDDDGARELLVRAHMKPLHPLLPLVMLAGPAFAQVAPPPPDASVSWFRILDEDGAQIGHRSQQVTQSAEGRETVSLQELLFQEPDEPVTRTTSQTIFEEDADGHVVSIRDDSRTGRTWTRTTVRIEADEAVITRATRSGSDTVEVPLPPGVRFDGGSALLRGWNGVRTLEFPSFNFEAQAVERVTLEPAPDSTPGHLAAIRKRYDGQQLLGVARLELGPDGRLAATIQPMFGSSITVVPATREEALAEHPPFHALASVRIPSPVRIERPAAEGHLRYRFGFRDGIVFAPPETGEQRVTLVGDEATVDICDGCGPGLPTDPAFLADALRATPWLQSDHPRIRAIADRIAGLRASEARKMVLLTTTTMTLLDELEFVGHHSALETLDRRTGDCTEAAVLLAALGRAAGIPTKVVNGLVYSRERYHGVSHAFAPHSWVVAFVGGAWRSYDAALFDFDSTHVALAVGDGDPRSLTAASQLASLLTWTSMVEVRTY